MLTIHRLAALAFFSPAVAILFSPTKSRTPPRRDNAKELSDDFKLNKHGELRQRLTNYYDVSYTGVIKIGGQPVKAIIDTGSFELLVFSVNCTYCGSPENLYDGTKSRSHNYTGANKSHYYGSGSAETSEISETVRIGSFHAWPQSLWEVFAASMDVLSWDAFASIFGVGPPTSAAKMADDDKARAHRQLEEMKRANINITDEIKAAVRHYDEAASDAWKRTQVVESMQVRTMSHCLGRQPGSDGFYIWNDTAFKRDPKKFTKVKTTGDMYWSANMTWVKLPSFGKHVSALTACPGNQSCTAVFDTGTSLISAPMSEVWRIQDMLNQWLEHGNSCDDLSSLPNLEFSINGVPLTLPPEAYVGKIAGTDEPSMFRTVWTHAAPKNGTDWLGKRSAKRRKHSATASSVKGAVDDDSGECRVTLMPMDMAASTGPIWILGMPFFREFYTTFIFKKGKDKGHHQPYALAFSKANEHCNPGWAPGKKEYSSIDGIDTLATTAHVHHAFHIDAAKVRVPHLPSFNRPPPLEQFTKLDPNNVSN